MFADGQEITGCHLSFSRQDINCNVPGNGSILCVFHASMKRFGSCLLNMRRNYSEEKYTGYNLSLRECSSYGMQRDLHLNNTFVSPPLLVLPCGEREACEHFPSSISSLPSPLCRGRQAQTQIHWLSKGRETVWATHTTVFSTEVSLKRLFDGNEGKHFLCFDPQGAECPFAGDLHLS